MKIKPSWIVIAVLGIIVIVLLMTRGCGQWTEKGEVVKTDTLIVPGDPYPVPTAVRVPEPVYIDTGRTVYLPGVPLPTDTDAIVRDYLVTRFYLDTLKNDTSMLAVVEDSVQANRIVSRKFTYQNRRPTAIISNTTITNKKEPWFKLYLGLNAEYSPGTKKAGFGPFATGTIRQGALLTYAYDAIGNTHQVGFGWKLSSRKK